MDLIYAARYTEVCDYAWSEDWFGKEMPSGIWHVDTASIPDFFKQIKNNSQRYVVVSPSCDYGVVYQKYNHPVHDLAKWVKMNATPAAEGYEDLHMSARVNRGRCNQFDKYSIKCWSFTTATFPIIPSNVIRWFLCNCEVDESQTVSIPFGIFGNKNSLENVNKINNYPKNKVRDKLLYVNFQFYNTERADLYRHFRTYFPDVTCKRDVPFDEYLEDLATHKFVLCPTGNGIDCYRTLESVYMGAIPILESRMGAVVPYRELQYPMLMYPNLFQVDPLQLEKMYSNIMDHWNDNIDLTKALWPYWKKRIKESI